MRSDMRSCIGVNFLKSIGPKMKSSVLALKKDLLILTFGPIAVLKHRLSRVLINDYLIVASFTSSVNSFLMILSAVSSLKKLPEPYLSPHFVRSTLIEASPLGRSPSFEIFTGNTRELVFPIIVKFPVTIEVPSEAVFTLVILK